MKAFRILLKTKKQTGYPWNFFETLIQNLQRCLSPLFQRILFLIILFFQKYLRSQVIINKMINSVVYHLYLSRIRIKDTSFHFSLNSPGPYISPECFLNFLWLVYSTKYKKNFWIYSFPIPTKCIGSSHVYSWPLSWIKTSGSIF